MPHFFDNRQNLTHPLLLSLLKQNQELWGVEERFSHYAVLYIKYIEIYRKLEGCYD